MTKRDRLMLMTVVAIAVLGGFWMLILSPQRKAAAEAEAQVTSAQTALSEARDKLNAGRRAQQAFRRDRTTIVKLGRVVPETDDIPTLLTQLQSLATKEKVKFLAYEVSSTAAASSTSSGATTTTTTDAKATDKEGNGSTAAVAPLFPPGSVEIQGGLGRTPISLEFEGSYFQLERYLRAVQRFAVLSQKSSKTNGRLMIVDGFAYERASSDGEDLSEQEKTAEKWSKQPKLTAKLSASVYFAPPLTTPSASASAGSGSSAASAASASGASSSTGTAAIGGVR